MQEAIRSKGSPQLIPFLLVQIRSKQIGFDRALSWAHPAYPSYSIGYILPYTVEIGRFFEAPQV